MPTTEAKSYFSTQLTPLVYIRGMRMYSCPDTRPARRFIFFSSKKTVDLRKKFWKGRSLKENTPPIETGRSGKSPRGKYACLPAWKIVWRGSKAHQ
jgi:hypothetical protein